MLWCFSRRPTVLRVLLALISICTLTALLLVVNFDILKEALVGDSKEGLDSWVKNDPVEPVEPVDLAAAVERLRRDGGEYRFKWTDWANLSMSEQYDYGNLDPAFYPHLSTLDDLSHLEAPSDVKTTQREAAMVGELYLRHRMPAPAMVIALRDTDAPNTTSDDGDGGDNNDNNDNNADAAPEVWAVRHADSERDHRQYGNEEYVVQTPTMRPQAADLESSDPRIWLLPEIGDDMFRWDPAAEAGELEASDSGEDQARARMLRQALAHVRASGKHLIEAQLLFDSDGYGSHYEWRFFHGVAPFEERQRALRLLVRAWSRFAQQVGLEYWWAHGSALGWMWNGMSMPWDSDADVQMPVRTLDRLAWEFNHTLVIAPGDDDNDGGRAYFIEVNPWYVQRTYGNGNNVIDARFIDVATGLYADITGLAYPSGLSRKMACKNGHRSGHTDVSPLRRTKFEGVEGFVPAKIENALRTEYSKAFDPEYEKWRFNAKSRLWGLKDECDNQNDKEHWNNSHCWPSKKLPFSDCKYTQYGTCDETEIKRYHETKELTLEHADEMTLWEEVSFASTVDARSSDVAMTLAELLKGG